MSYILLFYCFFSVVLATGGAFFFYSSGQQTTGMIYFVGAAVAAIFFGFRWFSSNAIAAAAATWPPSVNYCPDLLSLATVQGVQVCIDTVGVAQQGGMSTSNGSQTEDKYVFRLFLEKAGLDRVKLLCEEAKQKQVTWEGVWNGSTCSNIEPPRPGV